jgi:hypothetical protein
VTVIHAWVARSSAAPGRLVSGVSQSIQWEIEKEAIEWDRKSSVVGSLKHTNYGVMVLCSGFCVRTYSWWYWLALSFYP